MVSNPVDVVAALLVAGAISAGSARGPRLFRLLPPLLWAFVLSSLAAAGGVLPAESAGYEFCDDTLLPACVVLFLFGADLRLLSRLGWRAVAALLAGSVGVSVAGVVSFLAVRPLIGDEGWRQFAPLVAGWVAGYASMLAVKGSVGCSDEAFAPVLAAGSVLAYGWMALLAVLARYQKHFDTWVRAAVPDGPPADDRETAETRAGKSPARPKLCLWVGGSILMGRLCLAAGDLPPQFPPVFGGTSWGYLILLAGCGAASFLRPIRVSFAGSQPLANGMLLVVVASLGARCSVSAVVDEPVLFASAVLLLLVQACILVGVGYAFGIPASVLATASQANVGGVASAPVVANAYAPGSEPLGVMMALLAALLGLPLGLLAAQLMMLL